MMLTIGSGSAVPPAALPERSGHSRLAAARAAAVEHGEHRVRAQAGAVLAPVQLDQQAVELRLLERTLTRAGRAR